MSCTQEVEIHINQSAEFPASSEKSFWQCNKGAFVCLTSMGADKFVDVYLRRVDVGAGTYQKNVFLNRKRFCFTSKPETKKNKSRHSILLKQRDHVFPWDLSNITTVTATTHSRKGFSRIVSFASTALIFHKIFQALARLFFFLWQLRC